MKAILQRVNSAKVSVNGDISGEIDSGLLVLLGVMDGDTETEAKFLAKKTAELRIFCDDADKMNLSANDLKLQALVISNFTLYGDCSGGRRPYFIKAARPEVAEGLYECYVAELKKQSLSSVETGVFGGDMTIDMQCDGPVTLILDTLECMH